MKATNELGYTFKAFTKKEWIEHKFLKKEHRLNDEKFRYLLSLCKIIPK